LFGVFPRLVQLSRLGDDGASDAHFALVADNLTSSLLSELLHTPRILLGLLDGDLLFQRFAGENLVPVLPFFSGALLLLIAVRGISGKIALDRSDWALLGALLASVVVITAVAPWLALRYYAIPALGLPYLLVRLASSCMRVPRWPRTVGRFTLIAVTAAQLFYVGTNYFYAHLESGGNISVFPLGTRLKETSNHFVRTDALYAQLIAAGVETIFADGLLGQSVLYHDIETDHLRFVPNAGGEWLPSHGRSARIFYNGPTPIAGTIIIDPRGRSDVTLHGRRFALDESFDDHFRVFVYRP
jgi:hypothetical protein